MIDYYVRPVALPRTVEGVSIPNDDGTFDIYINSLLAPARRKAALEHELRHLKGEHFYREMPLSLMERQAEGELGNAVLHPPEGTLACFRSEAALARWLKEAIRQYEL